MNKKERVHAVNEVKKVCKNNPNECDIIIKIFAHKQKQIDLSKTFTNVLNDLSSTYGEKTPSKIR